MLVRNFLTSAIATVAVVLTGCQPENRSLKVLAQGKPKIVGSYSVLCNFIDIIAQDTVDLTCLIDGGQDPHAYRLAPSERKDLEQAQVIFYGGYDLEPQIIPLIEAIETDVPKIAVHEAVVTEPIVTEHHHHDDHEEKHSQEPEDEAQQTEELEADPHIWHNVENAIAMVEYLQSSLLQLNPNQAALYLENSAKLVENLRQLHAWVQEQIATIPEGKRILVTTHDALNYYVVAYELEDYKTLQGLSPDDSPSASDLRNLVTEIRQTQVPTIFAEVTANNRVINTVAQEAGVKLSDRPLLVDGLGKTGTDTDTYLKMIVNNTCAIVDGLGGQCQPFEN